jgi:hypothetical protein
MHESIFHDMLQISFLPHSAVIMNECRELLLVDSCNLHCAMMIPLVQLNVWVEETNRGFGVHHQFVGNFVVMRYWWWVLIAITSCCSFRFCLFWQSGGWTLGIIQHRGRSSQVSESCMSSCCSSHKAAWIKFFFPFVWSLFSSNP